ncbi:hypothetical protein [Erythrobacter dokdonensis]|nr:hypothetical protein [Erythrobacter dokdonensis]
MNYLSRWPAAAIASYLHLQAFREAAIDNHQTVAFVSPLAYAHRHRTA